MSSLNGSMNKKTLPTNGVLYVNDFPMIEPLNSLNLSMNYALAIDVRPMKGAWGSPLTSMGALL